MSTATKTLQLPFLRLNRAKAEDFARLQRLNTTLANAILAMPKAQRRALTSKSFTRVELGSTWINQLIRQGPVGRCRRREGPAAYTTQSCHRCGQLNPRKKHAYRCARCGRQAHADANAAQHIRDWLGWCCPWALDAPMDGPHDTAPNTIRNCTAQTV